MYIIIVKENIDNEEFMNSLFFNFNSKEDALNFINYILSVSNYAVEILPPKEEQ